MLEAGRRAEGEGKRDHAIQFYQHVLNYHGASQEAAEAGQALSRLEFDGYDQGDEGPTSGYPQGWTGAAATPSARPMPQQVAGNGHPTAQFAAVPQPRAPQPGHGQAQIYPRQYTAGEPPQHLPRAKSGGVASSAGGKTGKRQKPTIASEGHEDQRPHQPKVRRYRLGRFMAGLSSTVGLIAAIAGMVALGANVVLWATKMQNGLLTMLAISPLVAATLTGIACVFILLGQMARATFDAAARPIALAAGDDGA